jgi:hypothetical protein
MENPLEGRADLMSQTFSTRRSLICWSFAVAWHAEHFRIFSGFNDPSPASWAVSATVASIPKPHEAATWTVNAESFGLRESREREDYDLQLWLYHKA